MDKSQLTDRDLIFLMRHHPNENVREKAGIEYVTRNVEKENGYRRLIEILKYSQGEIPKRIIEEIEKRLANAIKNHIEKYEEVDTGDLYDISTDEKLPMNAREVAGIEYVNYFAKIDALMNLLDVSEDKKYPKKVRDYAREKSEEVIRNILKGENTPFDTTLEDIATDPRVPKELRKDAGLILVEESAKRGLYSKLDEIKKNKYVLKEVKKKAESEFPNAIKKYLNSAKENVSDSIHPSWYFELKNIEKITQRQDIPESLKEEAKKTLSEIPNIYVKKCLDNGKYYFLSEALKEFDGHIDKKLKEKAEREVNKKLDELAELLYSS